MLRDLNSVLDYFAQLNELDTTSVPPIAPAANQLIEERRGRKRRLNISAPMRLLHQFLNRERVLVKCSGHRRYLLQSAQGHRALAARSA